MADREREERDAPPPIEIPHDVVNEQIVVAAALSSAEAREYLVKIVSPDLFVQEQHRAVWVGLREMRRRKLDHDLATLHALVSGDVELSYMRELASAYPEPPLNLERHVSALRWDRVRVESVRGPISELLKALRDPRAPQERVRALGLAVGTSLDVATDRRFMRDPVEVAREGADEVRGRRDRGFRVFGLRGLDVGQDGKQRMLPGAEPGKMTIVTGVPGGGKSVLCARLALEQARAGRLVLYFPWEMGSAEVLGLMAVMSLRETAPTDEERERWTRWRISAGDLDDAELGQLRERMERIGDRVRFCDALPGGDKPAPQQGGRWQQGPTANDRALESIRHQVADSACETAVFDLWERAFTDLRPEPERRALFETQQILKDARVHGILAAQQRLKDVEQRDDPRPTREGIFGSGAWVDVADTILGVHRPAQWAARADDTLEVIVLKQRYGRWPFSVEFAYDPTSGEISGGRDVEYRREAKRRAGKDDFEGIGGRR